MTADDLARVVALACLAPSVHNVQPARWRLDGDDILIAADLSRALPASDPAGRDAGLSCGAAVEATVIALAGQGRCVTVQDLWEADDRSVWPGLRLAARLSPASAMAPDHAAPGLAIPDIVAPDTVASDTEVPDTEVPDFATTDRATTDLATTDLATTDLASTDLPSTDRATVDRVALLRARFTHRAGFLPAAPDAGSPDASSPGVSSPDAGSPGAWSPADAVVVTDAGAVRRIATDHDRASLTVLREARQRAELLHWMRLRAGDPRALRDGMSAAALRMGPITAGAAGLVLGPLWPLVSALGLGGVVASEAAHTRSAAAIALFHRPAGESPVTSGRAYLRLWLDATARGWAGWPMAALTDDPLRNRDLAARHGVPTGHRLIQALRLGPPDAAPPPRARLPLDVLIP